MSRPALSRRILRLVAVAAAAGLLLILLVRPVTVRQSAFPPGNDWPARPILPDRPVTLSIVAPIGGLSEVWVRRAGPASDRSVIGAIRPADGGPPIQVTGEPVSRSGRDYFRFAFPPIDRSAGRRYSLSLSTRDDDASRPVPMVVEAPGRYYPDGDPAERRQIPFDVVYATAGGRVAADLARRLGGVEGERWAPSGVVAGLFAAEAALLVALIALTRRVGRPA